MNTSLVTRLLLGLLILLILACAAIGLDGLNDRLHSADLGVVLGNKVYSDGRPSEMLQARLDQAVLLYNDGYFKMILVSGATGRERQSEPDVMAHYLYQAGIPSSAIFKDADGTDTFHTARNTARFLKERHLHSVLVVSQYFHMTRCRLAFGRFGIAPIYRATLPFSV
jgi:vancomycin permeability regulator SanA